MTFAELFRRAARGISSAAAAPPAPTAAPARRGVLERRPGLLRPMAAAPGITFAVLAGLRERKPKKRAGPPAAPRPLPHPERAPQRPISPRGGPIDPDPTDEMCGHDLVAMARRRERARCEAIVTSPAGLQHPALARKLALETRMPRGEALQLIELQPTSFDRSASSAARAARNPRIGAGVPEGLPPAAEIARGWDRAFKAAAPRQQAKASPLRER